MTVGKYNNQHLPTEEQKSFSKSCRKKIIFYIWRKTAMSSFVYSGIFLRNHHIMHEEGR